MITTRRYLEGKIEAVQKETERLSEFNEQVYSKRHEELEKRVESLEKVIVAQTETEKHDHQLRSRFYTRITIVIGIITVLVLILDQVVIDHILH
jgi:hypothetical protein